MVSHSSEIGYVFNQPKPAQPPLQDYWVNFVKTGDPNGVDRALPHWPCYSVVDEDYMAFEQAGPSGRRHLRSEICRLRDVP